jgi:prepilin-type N-terminal cleavage/methylation domain-containing protein
MNTSTLRIGELQMNVNSEKGFTLIEIIIAMAVFSTMLGIASMSIYIIYANSVEANVQELRADIQDVQYRSMTEYDQDYQLKFTYDTSKQQYGYVIETKTNGSEYTTKNKVFPKHFIFEVDNGGWIALPISTNNLEEKFTYRFSYELGEGLDTNFDGESLTTFATSGTSKIRVRSNNTSKEMGLTVVQLTGRVIVDEN